MNSAKCVWECDDRREMELTSDMLRLLSLEYRLLKEDAMNPRFSMSSLQSEKSSLVLSTLCDIDEC